MSNSHFNKKAAIAAIGGTVIAPAVIAMFLSAGTAHADCVANNGAPCTIISGGHMDPAAVGYVAQLAANGDLPPDGQWIVAPYSAEIGTPFTPGAPMNVSTDEGAQVALDIYNGLPKNQQNQFQGYSEGAVASIKAANGVTCGNFTTCDGAPAPDGVKVVMDGDPNGSTGILSQNSYLVQNPIVEPIVNGMGIQTDIREPAGTERYYHQNDTVANGGVQDPIGLLTTLTAFSSHAVQNREDPHVTWEGQNGEINHEYGIGTNPWTTLGESQGHPIDSATNDFFNVVNPVEHGVPIADQLPLAPGLPSVPFAPPNFEAPPGFVPPAPIPVPAFAPPPVDVPVVPVELPVQQMSGQMPAEHSTVPSFPGELPCPGGYFTPGDAAC